MTISSTGGTIVGFDGTNVLFNNEQGLQKVPIGGGTGTATQTGLLANLPTLALGATYLATDVNILFVGTLTGNIACTALPLTGLAANIPTNSPVGFLYFATDTQVLYVALPVGQGNIRVVPLAPIVPIVGVAVVTGTSEAIALAAPFTTMAQPIVLLTPFTQAPSYWVTFQGAPNNWTGFTINCASTFFGAFNYVVFAN